MDGELAALKKDVERVGSAYESAVAALAIRDEVGLATAMWTWLSSRGRGSPSAVSNGQLCSKGGSQ